MDKIAVIGLACLFPDAKNPEQFWRNLLAEKDSRSMATRQEIEVDPQYFYAPNKGVYDKTYYLKGGYVRDFNFDPTGYNLSPEFLGQLDKLFQWSLYVAREALADSGYLASNPNPSNLKEMGKAKCGVIMGNLSYPTRLSRQLFTDIYRQAMQPIIQNLLGQDDFILQTTDIDTDVRKSKLLCSKPLPYNALVSGYLTTVIAQALGLSQVNFSIDAACASSLYAVKLACYYLQAGKADLMLAGGISAPAPLFVTLGFASLQGYPDNGISQPLDKQSKGLTSGEGAGMVVLKRYADAVRDGDKIQAVIPAIGLSNDGRGKHLLIPNPRGQQLAFERAYREAGISPTEIAYVECHATGTPVGDNIELNSTADFFGQYNHIPLISSVKTNVGHLLTAAGIVSMLKAILAMQHGIIPPTIGINDPLVSSNKQITDSHLIRTAVRWTEQGNIKRSAVSAFGFGGTNAHMVLEYHTSNPSHLKGRSKAPHPNPSPFKERDNWRGAKLAIVGMGAYFGQCDDLESYAETIHSGKQHFIPLPPQRWHGLESNSELMHEVGFDEGKAPLGAYIESFEIDAFRGKIPPNEAHTIHPQQLLMLRVTNQALEDAGYTLKDKAKNVAVIIAMETDPSLHRVYSRWDLTWQLSASLKKSGLTLPEEKLTELEILLKDCTNYPMGSNQCLSYIGNVMASRISSLWNFTCPSFTLSAEENSVFRALEVAQILLEMEEVESVVVGAVDLAGGFEHVVLQQKLAPMNTGKSTMSFDHDVNGWLVGEGAGAVVLKRADNVQKAHDKIYAVIESVSLVQSPNNVDFEIQPQGVQKRFCTPHVEMHTPYIQAMQEAFAQADVSPHEIGYVEVCGSGIDWQDEAEMDGLHAVYRHDAKSKPLSCAIGSVKANIGHTFVASGMASLIKTALCLHQKYIPATPNWSAPKRLAEWQKSPFYIATESRPWFVVQPQKHLAAIGSLSIDGTAGHVVLSGASTHIKPRFDAPGASQSRFDIESGIEHALRQEGPFILPIGANDESEIYRKIRALRENIEHADSLSQLAQETFGTFQNQGDTRYVACLVGKNKVELDKQIKKAMSGIRHAFETNLAWQTPQGSYFTPNPLGETGEIAFVYPGAFNSYLGIAREMFQLFPQTHNYLHKITPDIGFSMDDKLVYPRSLTAINQDNKRAFEEKLKTDSVAMIKSCLTCDTLFTKILRHTFKLEPNSAFGYSLGETGMFWGLDVWDDASNSHHLLANSELYTTRLSGPHNAIREAWRIPAHVSDDEIWKTYIVLAPVALVQSIVNLHRQVFIIIINTNHEVVIAGNPKACRQVIRQLDCRYMEIEANDAIHCPPIKSEYGEFVHLHTYEINDIKNIKFYSSAYHDQLPLTYDGIPRTIAEMACNQVDFPRLVQRVYDDGARIFVELGPGRTCTRWIGENLKGQPHLATAINKKGVADYTGLIRMLTKLVSHKVKLDVSPLYRPTSNQSKRKGIFKTITLGGNRLADTILTDENRDKFMPFVGKQELGVGSSDLGATTLALSEETTPDSSGVTKPHFVMDTEIMKDETQRSTDEMTLREDKLSDGHQQDDQYIKMSDNVSTTTKGHALFLQTRQIAMHQMHNLIQEQIRIMELGVRNQELGVRNQELGVRNQELGVRNQESGVRNQELGVRNQESGVRSQELGVRNQELGVRSQESGVRNQESGVRNQESGVRNQESGVRSQKPESVPVVWDYDELLTFAEGNIADVFGKEYASIDTYKVRVRLPTPPYLLVSRVTDIKAKLGEYKPSFVQTEYDIPHNSWYTVDGQAPWAVAVESGQCDLLLISYIGIDLQNKGERMYRLLDCTLTFVDELPYEGQTLRYDIYIDSYARSGDILLFFFRYDCYADDKKVLIMQGGSAGFFSQKELDEGKGIIVTKEELEERAKIPKQHFTPLLHTNKTRFNRADIVALSHGNIAACFGSHYDQKGHNPSLRLPPEKMLMVDRITQLDFHGGPWGLGMMIAEKDIAPDDWYFPCHFMDDAVLAGSLMAEGCLQMMQAYMLSIGLQHATKDARFQPIPNLKQIVRCRGQVIPTYDTMEYRLEVKEIGLDPNPYSIANVDIIFENKIVVRFENLGVQLVEKERVRSQELGVRSQEQQRLLYHEVVAQWTPRHALYTEEQLIEFSEGSIVKCFGSEYQIYETKRCPRTPNGDLQLISRIVELNAERYNFKSKSSLVSEYDVPVNPWYCEQNNYPMPPYSILMEMALQPCGFLSAYLGSTLPYPDEDFYFRNLDGTGELLREMDIRGKTVSNKVTFISSTFFSGIILQKYEFELSCDGQAFYKGVTTFGYFTKEALKNQVGLDGGNYKSPYHETATGKRYTINLLSQETPPLQICGVEVWFPKQLDFLDKVIVMPNGGKFGKGYVFAESMIDPEAWFFKAHFYLDPVMPGSLGVEAILQALQAYALQQDLGQQMNSPRFGHVENHTTVWKYRGQISHERHQMYLEVHIKEINQTPDMITIIGEASLWKKGMRIYEVKDIAICIREG